MTTPETRSAYQRLTALAEQIERDKPYGCSVYRGSDGSITFSFGIQAEDLPKKLLPRNPMVTEN